MDFVTDGYFRPAHPDDQVRHVIELLFLKFEELGSCRRVMRYLRQESILLPRHQPTGLHKGVLAEYSYPPGFWPARTSNGSAQDRRLRIRAPCATCDGRWSDTHSYDRNLPSPGRPHTKRPDPPLQSRPSRAASATISRKRPLVILVVHSGKAQGPQPSPDWILPS